MYKLFLCLRYLRRRIIAYFAMLGVLLCVAMMLIAVSVMNGFLRHIEVSAKGLFGDIVVESDWQDGIAHYDEFIAAMKRDVPEVQEGTPFILSVGFLRIPGAPTFRRGVQVAGIRLPGRAEVTDFENGLFVQKDDPHPTFGPDPNLLLQRLSDDRDRMRRLAEGIRADGLAEHGTLPPETEELLYRIGRAIERSESGANRIRYAPQDRTELRRLQEQLDAAREGDDEDAVIALENAVSRMQTYVYEDAPSEHVILGLGIPGLSFRTPAGEHIRDLPPGWKVIVDVFPLGRAFGSTMDLNPARATLSIADDCRTGVSTIDSEIVYLDFDKLQAMNNMDLPEKRCSQIHVKVRGAFPSERELRDIGGRIERVRLEWNRQNPERTIGPVSVMSWRQRQETLVGSIEAQRTLVVIMFGIMSLVSVVLIFVIFYMIVMQKTREIGILKAVGASSWGVAAIFLGYGAAIGLVGAFAGSVVGWLFVYHINPIHDWVGRTFGLVVWDRAVFMFDTIPNEVQWNDALLIVGWSMLSGVVGAIIPALRAARMQPVEALRYE